MRHICLVPLDIPGQGGLLDTLAEAVGRSFGLPVRRRGPWFDPMECFDDRRGQCNSTQVLRRLLEGAEEDCVGVLGVTGLDLFIPVLTYVFGEAQLEGKAAVVSVFRLDNEAYGLPPDAALLTSRLIKEGIHELGHTRGLVHCTDPRCVMASSTYVEEIDLKDAEFCGRCLTALRASLGA